MVPTLLALTAGLWAQGPAASPAPARDFSGEAVVIERFSTRARFESDGTGSRTVSSVVRVQSAAGVQQYGQLIFGYNSANEALDIAYVRVRKPGGEVTETPAQNVQDLSPEVLRAAPVYSDYREKHVTVVGLRPGDLLEYEFTTRLISPLAPDQFWFEYQFGKDVVVFEESLELDVPRARQIHLKSPGHPFQSREAGERRLYTWSASNLEVKRPAKPQVRVPPEEPKIDLQLSTFSDWKQVAQWYAGLQRERTSPTDEIRRKALELTAGAASDSEKARRIYDYVAQNVRYVSLSFGIGRFQPHAAVEVLKNQYGDCKDKHTLLASLLSAVDIPSYPVLIHTSRTLDEEVPSPAQFDHLISAVPLAAGWVWLDTTTEVAPYGLIAFPLRGKQALLASTDLQSGLHETPPEAPVPNTQTFTTEGKFSELGDLDADIAFTAQGDSDLLLRLAFRKVPQEKWTELVQLFSMLSHFGGEVSNVKVGPLDQTDRPLQFQYHYHRKGYFEVPSQDAANSLPLPPLNLQDFDDQKGGSSKPLKFDPLELTYRARVQFPKNFSVHAPVPIQLRRDYAEYTSTYSLQGDTLVAERHVKVKVRELPPSRLADYNAFRKAAMADEDQQLTAQVTAPALASPAASAKPEELHDAGEAALQRKDYGAAAGILRRLVDLDPKSGNGWDLLGQAYSAMGQEERAITAFRKQVEVNPFHERAYGNLGAELQKLGRHDEAIAAYRKQLEVDPLSASARRNLGLLLVWLKRYKEALPELEAAVKLSPDALDVRAMLGTVYLEIGQREKGQALLTEALREAQRQRSQNHAPAGDPYAAAMRDDPNADPEDFIDQWALTLDDLARQFDSGDLDRDIPRAFAAMHTIAVAWAGIGWAHHRKGEEVDAERYLKAAWMLSQSATVAHRLGQVYEQQGRRTDAIHMYILSAAASGGEAEAARVRLAKLLGSEKQAREAVFKAGSELSQMRSIRLPVIIKRRASAEFDLQFSHDTKPEKVTFSQGSGLLQDAPRALAAAKYPVLFPDDTPVKILRRGVVSCGLAGCMVVLLPLETVQPQTFFTSPAIRPPPPE